MQIKPQPVSRGPSQPVRESGGPAPKEQPAEQAAPVTGSVTQSSSAARQDGFTLSPKNESASDRSLAALLEAAKERTPKRGPSSPEDNSAYLTRRLVSSKKQIDITDVKAQIAKSIASLRMSVSSGDRDYAEKVRAVIKKLEKLMQRCHRKVRDLNKSDLLNLRRKQAEKNMQRNLEQELKAELERHEKKRKLREQRYLSENRGQRTPGELARIVRLAQVQSAAQVTPAVMGSVSAIAGAANPAAGAAPAAADIAAAPEVPSIDVSV